jgi:hypothetical protein
MIDDRPLDYPDGWLTVITRPPVRVSILRRGSARLEYIM